MRETDRICRMLGYELAMERDRLKRIETELEGYPDVRRSIAVKKIKGRLYYYLQWREDGKIHWKYLRPVSPGAVAKYEDEIRRYNELTEQRRDARQVISGLEQLLSDMRETWSGKQPEEDFFFEVFWEDEITARVNVKGSRVQVSPFVDDSSKQLFSSTSMTRQQLYSIFEQRCWDRGRSDIAELLNQIGLDEYNPYEIVKRTHGVSPNDRIWLRFPGERLTGSDVLVKK